MSSVEVFCLVAGMVSILFSGLTAGFSIQSYCKVVAMEKSTHQVAWVPMPTPEDHNTGKDLVKEFGENVYPDQFKENL